MTSPGPDAARLLAGYASGIFPMAETRTAHEVFWIDPQRRAILPLDGFHISRSLGKRMRRKDYGIRFDHAFAEVLDACAARPETWINAGLRQAYLDLHAQGRAHSVEITMDGALAGGVFGVALGAAFFGESMFSRRTDASKLALAHLVEHLRRRGFRLFDAQFLTAHLASLGAVEISRAAYHERLRDALETPAAFGAHLRN